MKEEFKWILDERETRWLFERAAERLREVILEEELESMIIQNWGRLAKRGREIPEEGNIKLDKEKLQAIAGSISTHKRMLHQALRMVDQLMEGEMARDAEAFGEYFRERYPEQFKKKKGEVG